MRILKRGRYGDEIAEIFAVYWDKRGDTLFLGMTDKYSGLHAYSADEVEIIDPNINFRMVYFSDGNLPAILHWALIEKNLLDEVIDGNIELRKEFLDILRSENVIDW